MILEGMITKVEAGKSAITVKTVPAAPQATPGQGSPAQPAGKETAFSVKKETPITLDGKKVALLELKAGQKVKVTYEGTNASSIEAKTK